MEISHDHGIICKWEIEQAVECKLLVPIYLLRELDKDLVSKGIHNKVELWRVFYQSSAEVQGKVKAEWQNQMAE